MEHMADTQQDRKRELITLITRARKYGQDTFAQAYEAELRALG